MAFFVQLAIAIALTVISYVIMPKPKAAQPEATKDLEDPTAEAGRPVQKVFGTLTVKGVNGLWCGEKSRRTYKRSA